MAQYRKDRHEYLADGRTIFEVMMLADQYGNLIGPANPSGVAVDAFGRARSSQPITLFDSFHRYEDNNKFSTATTTGGSTTFDTNSSTVSLTVSTLSGAKVQRETTKVFAYQPGKSLLILNTFVMNAPQTNLSQRVGYFNDQNGIFIEQTGSTIRFGLRSYVGGSVSHVYANQANWNIDTLLGAVSTSPSQKTLDLTKAQIFWCDIEWLGVGSVRCGFVIDGQMIHCHTFHHANILTETYMTTACLPVRYEIENSGTTAASATLKQICSSVVSEGGYETRGKSRSYGLEPVSAVQRSMATAGTYYPIVSIRLKSTRLDSIVVPRDISVAPVNSALFKYQLVSNATITGATWVSAGSDSAIEYNSNNAATMSGGIVLKSGLINATNQAAASISLNTDMFELQLERNGLTATPGTLTLALTSGSATVNAIATMDWEEFT